MAIAPERIIEELTAHYRPEEFPVLLGLFEQWSKSRPLEGLRVIDASPVFFNTCAKYAALLAAGAQLTVAFSKVMPHDQTMFRRLDAYGITHLWAEKARDGYDVVMDCAGALAHLRSRYGYVELTRSGAQHYADCAQPVFMVDDGNIKRIETCLGTGESFFRALRRLNYPVKAGESIVVIGGGKVGRGIALNALNKGLRVSVADVADITPPHPDARLINLVKEPAEFHAALDDCAYAVTATGRLNALRAYVDARRVCRSAALLANMGVEDEWGPDIPKDRILNHGKPLNFILPDPTLMCYIDPPLALHNQGAVELVNARVKSGINPPDRKIEELFLKVIRERGIIPPDMLRHIY